MSNIDQFISKSKPELQQELSKYSEDLRKLRFDLSFNKLKNVQEISKTRRNIARIKTLLNKN